MLFAETRGSGLKAADVVRLLAARGVLCLDEEPWAVRFVTHLDVDDADVAEAGRVVVEAMEDVARRRAG